MTTLHPWSSFITLADIYGLYREGIRRYGGDASNPKPGCVESSIAAAWNAESYTDSEQSHIPGLVFAGYLLYYLAMNHCFSDGNKRVAWTSAMHVLLTHGLTVDASTDEAEQLMLSMITGSFGDGMAVAHWLAERVGAVESFR